jgi:hypothetical protein
VLLQILSKFLTWKLASAERWACYALGHVVGKGKSIMPVQHSTRLIVIQKWKCHVCVSVHKYGKCNPLKPVKSTQSLISYKHIIGLKTVKAYIIT